MPWLQDLTRNMKAREVIEMAQLMLGRKGKPYVQDPRYASHGVDLKSEPPCIYAWADGVLSNGEHQHVKATAPLRDDDIQKLNLIRAIPADQAHERYSRIRDLEDEIFQHEFVRFNALAKKARLLAWEWINREEPKLKYEKIKKPESLSLDYPVMPLTHGLRFVRFARGSRKAMDTLAAVAKSLKPGEDLVRVEGTDNTVSGDRYNYYFIFTPEERQEFDNRRRRAERERVGGMLGGS